jgi:hypothetical protein
MKGFYKLENDIIIFEDKEITLSSGEIIKVQDCENTMTEIEGWRWFRCRKEAKLYLNSQK